MLNQLKYKLHHYFLTKRLKKVNLNRSYVNLSKAKSVGILFDANIVEHIAIVDAFVKDLKNNGKDVTLLGYLKNDKKKPTIDFPYFTAKDTSWIGIPAKEKTGSFVKKEFDLLINLYTHECLPLEFISTLSNAKYRVGRYIDDKTYCYDLMIRLEERKDLTYLIEHTNHYLKEINKNVAAV